MEQIELEFGQTIKVGCRVDGKIQHYHVDAAYSINEARGVVKADIQGANPILAVIVNKEKTDDTQDDSNGDFSHTTSPKRA